MPTEGCKTPVYKVVAGEVQQSFVLHDAQAGLYVIRPSAGRPGSQSSICATSYWFCSQHSWGKISARIFHCSPWLLHKVSAPLQRTVQGVPQEAYTVSLLQFLFTVGTVVLGLFVASRVLGIEAGEGRQGKGRSGKKQKWGSGRCVCCICAAFFNSCMSFTRKSMSTQVALLSCDMPTPVMQAHVQDGIINNLLVH